MKSTSTEQESLKLLQLALAAVALLPLVLSGCAAMADSSASIASITSISASSAAAMSSVDDAFRNDVRMMAATSAESGAGSAELLRNIGQVANDHGIADWESNAGAFYAVGEGLRQAGVEETQLLAMAPELTQDSEAKASLLKGFRTA